MPWEGSGLAGGGTVTGGRPGSVCPQGWTEDFDRAQMATQVFIGRRAPTIPAIPYTWDPGPGTHPTGTIDLDDDPQDSTHMYISRTDSAAADASIWLGYLHTDCTVTVKSPDNKTKGYRVTATPTVHTTYVDVPISWTDGTEVVPPGPVELTITFSPEAPLLYEDSYGTANYGRMPFVLTDLINTDRTLFETLADRILEVRGSNSVPRLETVTIDARTGKTWPTQNMTLMSTAAPEKPSRYLMRLEVDDRTIFDRMAFCVAVRHFISPEEWTMRITLDIAEWAGTL